MTPDQPVWRSRYPNDPLVLVNIIANHQREIVRAEKLIEFCRAEIAEIRDHLNEVQ